ncbi:hypothetical protein MP228_001051 [Amoeboaphelidium protococcarum]|nr:hypothetical protein MP228_001051 [Amoeboaphelidium protococcarum]
MTSRKVLKAILSREQGEGVGAKVRRSIGRPELRNFDPFLMLDEFSVGPPSGFPDHPHRGFETVTYLLSGRFAHEDFAGHKGEIGPGDLQWMTAGRGIVHAEMPLQPSHGLQLWVNLPKVEKMCEPRYQELKAKQIPSAFPFGPDGKVEIKVIAGESFGVSSPVYTKTPVYYLDVQVKDGAAESFVQQIPPGWNSFIYTLTGKIKVGENETVCEPHNTLVLSNEEGQTCVKFTPTGEAAHFVVIAGKPLNEPVVQHGPFVMTTQQEIQETFVDYQYGRNGFERAPSFKSSISKSH